MTDAPEPTVYRCATALLDALMAKHFPEREPLEHLPDSVGVLTQIDNLTTALTRADLAPAWQDIATAKDDVGHCLFFGATRHDTNVCFSGWVAQNGRTYSDGGNLCKPTHWMPHPAPPQEKETDDANRN